MWLSTLEGMTCGDGRVKVKGLSVILFSRFGLIYSGEPAGNITAQHLFSGCFWNSSLHQLILDLTREACQTCSAPNRAVELCFCHIGGESDPVGKSAANHVLDQRPEVQGRFVLGPVECVIFQ